MNLPKIIQGGMGVGVSGWELARAVSSCGQLGVVSGVGIDVLMIRKLQVGDPGGYIRFALDNFPYKATAKRIVDTFFKEKGKKLTDSFKLLQMPNIDMSIERLELIVAASFAEVFLAKQGHNGVVGINLLEKIQTTIIPTLYGAMLAGVDYVTMGAGIPREVPGVLDKLSKFEETSYRIHVTGASADDVYKMTFNPADYGKPIAESLKRPQFLAIVASNTLAQTLAKKANGQVNGFIIEEPTAGGHNAPPRGEMVLNENGEPVYGEKDIVNIEKIKELGLPFWLAGSYGTKEKFQLAISLGAAGIQTGTPFMLCKEAGLTEENKRALYYSQRKVKTDPYASPTGFPFKVASLKGTLSEEEIYKKRERRCNLGNLREIYKKDDNTIGYRCPAEPLNLYIAKGGKSKGAEHSKCLCNGLFADIGLGDCYKNGYCEAPIVTAGDALTKFDYLEYGYTAKDVVDYLLSK